MHGNIQNSIILTLDKKIKLVQNSIFNSISLINIYQVKSKKIIVK